MTRTGTRFGAIVMVAGLLASAACGRSSGTPGSLDSGRDTQATTNPSNGDFGTLKEVCGPAKDKNVATGRGVKADSINLGVISDAGFVGKPGLNQELWDASDVFVKWCNSQGGINGRQLVGTHLDAALTQYKQQILVACQNAFALVGGGGVADDAGERPRLSCLLPSFPGFMLTPVARGSDLKWQVTPAPLNEINGDVFRWLGEKFPDAKSSIGILTANVSATIVVSHQLKEVVQKLGFKLADYDEQYNALGEASWVPFATAMKNKGVKGLLYLGEPQDLGKLEQAMVAIGYKPQFIETLPNIYDRSFLAAAHHEAFNTFVPVANYPFELADQKAAGSEAMQKYLALFAKYSPKGKARTYLGVASFASWLLFAEAAKPCGANLTPRCLYDNAQKITHFDAGGLIAPSNPAGATVPTCGTIIEVEGDKFSITGAKANQGVFSCDSSGIVKLSGNYGKGIRLSDVGKSVADLK